MPKADDRSNNEAVALDAPFKLFKSNGSDDNEAGLCDESKVSNGPIRLALAVDDLFASPAPDCPSASSSRSSAIF